MTLKRLTRKDGGEHDAIKANWADAIQGEPARFVRGAPSVAADRGTLREPGALTVPLRLGSLNHNPIQNRR